MGVAQWLRDNLRDTSETRELPATVSRIYQDAGANPEKLLHSFKTFAAEGFGGNGPVFSLIAVRMQAFTETRLVFVRNSSGEVVTDHPRLRLLQTPWPNGTTADLLALMELDVSLSGNSYVWNTGSQLQRLRPDLVDIVWDFAKDGSQTLLGYVWWKDGRHVENPPPMFVPIEAMAHYKLYPHPTSHFLGASWLSSVAGEVDADQRMNIHKNRFFHNAATPNMAILTESQLSSDQKKALREMLSNRYAGAENAFKTIVLEGGADIRVLGHSMEQSRFDSVQAAGETRLAAAAGVPPVVVGFLQGIQAATYSNYSQAMRRFADLTIRPMWRQAVGALASITSAPQGTHLWYDVRDVGFLQQDGLDAADIQSKEASTLETLIRSGFTAESAVEAVATGRFDRLDHSGLVSVQLQPPGTESPSTGDGSGNVVDNQVGPDDQPAE